ncbi:hypothetical protein [Pseudomonas sp. UFMG81]|uniref:hypothetical protein n=1 Tax=Pseudomonas sp. UFMG81 TaxID=2745936 RepID=UPI00189060A0|nr:hypothetical protein [Pseudomonas sp. UFMG81]
MTSRQLASGTELFWPLLLAEEIVTQPQVNCDSSCAPPCGSGFSREAGDTVDGTGSAGVRG